MASFGDIAASLEKRFHISIKKAIPGQTEISGIRLLSDFKGQNVSFHDTFFLYLGQYCDFKQAELYPNCLLFGCPPLPEDCPVSYSGQNPDLKEVLVFLQDELAFQYQANLKKEELFGALYRGAGLHGILYTAWSYLENTIAVCDTSFKLLDSVPVLIQDSHFDKKGSNWYINDFSLNNMINNHVIENIYCSHLPCRTTFDDSNYEWIFAGINIRNAVVGFICLFSSVRPFTDKDLAYLKVLEHVLSIELQKQDIFRAPAGMKYDFFLTELLDGQLYRMDYIKKQLEVLGFQPKKYYSLMMMRFEHREDVTRSSRSYYEELLSIVPSSMVIHFHGRITMLFSHDFLVPFTEETLVKLSSFLSFNRLSAAISYPFEDIIESCRYIQQAESILDMPGIKADENHLIRYEDHFFHHILHLTRSQIYLQDSIHPFVKQIIQYDKENSTKYLMTLKTYLQHNRNALDASKALHIHKSTFFYRMNKIASLFNIEIDNPTLLFAFEYSFALMEYLGEENETEV